MSSFKTLTPIASTRQQQKNTPVTTPLAGRETEMGRNDGGGFSFIVDEWTKLDRFLILGTEGGTYYATEQKWNERSLTVITSLLKQDGKRVVDRCVEISQAGRAKNNDYALYVMAQAISNGDTETKRYASQNLHLVARTGTHLMHFTAFANGLRGWGKNLKRAIQNWYGQKTPDQIAYQAVKYQSRDGWSQRDILRLGHVHPGNDALRNNVYKYIVKGRDGMTQGDPVPKILVAFEQAKTASTSELVKLISDNRLSHEMIPNDKKNDPKVWEAMLPAMGTTALIRNLNKMTAIGLLTSFSQATKDVVAKLTDIEQLKRDRIHPMTLLIARKQYALGRGDLGSLTWSPVQTIVKALEDAFYLSFAAVEPTGKNRMLAIDVSASMNSPCMSFKHITSREAAAVIAMVTLKREPWSAIYGFDHKFRDLGISASDSLETVMKKTYSPNFGSTDMSLPIELAMQQNWKVDSFEIYTDNEVNCGKHPSQSLKNYRSKMGKPDAKLVAVACNIGNFTIADRNDKGMLDVVGFDSQAPQFISAFVAGQL
jgi:60 kDa SS-A/Ro ribonucleoprotein